MHERGVVADVVREAERVCAANPGAPTKVRLTIGALSGLSPIAIDQHFRGLVGAGSPLDGIELDISTSDGLDPVRASTLSLDSVEFEGA